MKLMRRGMSCGLSNKGINKLLLFLSKKNYTCYLLDCLAIDKREMIIPDYLQDQRATETMLKEMATTSFFEFKFLMYPPNKPCKDFASYETFVESDCICCLLYYDCGWLDVYIKDDVLFEDVYGFLMKLDIEQFEIITDINDKREALSL